MKSSTTKLFIGIICSLMIVSLETFAQTTPTHIEVSSRESLNDGFSLEMIASESIVVKEGFKMGLNSTLILRVIPTNEISEPGAKEGPSIFPNPASEIITVVGTFSQSRMDILDQDGNLVIGNTLNGENPEVTISDLRTGTYILRVDGFSLRLLKD